jgi:hypothetical protein
MSRSRILRPCKALVLLGLALGWVAPALCQSDDASRQEAALAEEQALQRRQLRRLKDTMTTLAGRLEAEGRVHAAELLRNGLQHLAQREGDAAGRTVDELMDAAKEDIRSGRTNNALTSQEQIVENLQRLLDILMDRRSLENLEADLAELREIRAALGKLAEDEAKLRRDTEQLREDSATPEQRALEQAIEDAIDKQRELLERNERDARESGVFDLEQLKARLEALAEEQQVSSAVFERWSPADAQALEAAREALDRARAAEARAERLQASADKLRQAAAGARQGSEAGRKAADELEQAAEREGRAARASGDKVAERAAQALEAGAREFAAAKDQAQLEAAAAQAEARAAEVESAAEAARAGAQGERDEVSKLTGELAEQRTTAGAAAARVQEQLAQAGEASKQASRDATDRAAAEKAATQARESTEKALAELDAGLATQDRMGEALEASQAAAAQEAKDLAQDLEAADRRAASDGEGIQGAQDAEQALERAAEAMTRAQAAARAGQSESGRQASQEAEQALREAGAALDQALQAAGEQGQQESGAQSPSEQLRGEQTALAKQVEQAAAQAQQGSMGQQAQAAVEQALEQAQQAMEQAAAELPQPGQRSEAAASQRKALEALRKAAMEAEQGVEPQTPEERARAEELEQRQKEIEQQLLELARRNEERESPLPQPDLGKPAKSAESAAESLDQGDLDQAERQEEQTEREIREALDQLEEEEEQYQDLRQEELLFRMAEEIDVMLETLREQMAATREADAARAGRARPSRADRVRLRNLSREFETLAQRANVLREAIAKEGVLVFTEVMAGVETDLTRLGRDMGQAGGYRSGPAVRAMQEDVETSLVWLAEALDDEIERRQEEQEQQDSSGGQDPKEKPLVPDTAELRLLRQLEEEVLARLSQQLQLHPELADPEADLDPLLLEELTRLAYLHNRVAELFSAFREKIGIPAPGAQPEAHPPAEEGPDGDNPGAESGTEEQ